MNPYPMKQPDAIAMLDAERAIADQLFRASQDARWLRETLAKAGDDQELRRVAQLGYVKINAGRHPTRKTPREQGMGWRLS